MEISGPCRVIIKDGIPFNKYQITIEKKNYALSGSFWTNYYFETDEDANLYLLFLYQEEGLKFLNQQINSSKTFAADKKEYKDFRDSIDFSELSVKVRSVVFTKEDYFRKWTKRIKI